MAELVIAGTMCRLRPYRASDVEALQAAGDDAEVTRWMTQAFAHPYTRAHADAWLALTLAQVPPRHFVVDVDGEFAGAAGMEPVAGERTGTAIFGYWFARRFWGRGIATDAARTLARYAFAERGMRRLEATVFAPNTASARVLEKAGFTLEGRMRAGYVQRDGTACDGILYGRLASDPEP